MIMDSKRPCVGILGGGQLAQMLAHAAYSLGVETLCLVTHADEPAARNSKILIDTGTPDRLKEFADRVDVMTLENENVEISVLETLSQYKRVHPGVTAVKTAQDRLFEKNTFQKLEIPTVRFVAIHDYASLVAGWHAFDQCAILKTRRFGYDGKGQYRLKTEADLKAAWESMGHLDLILESLLAFDYEVSLIGARNPAGEMVFYPLIYNIHADGILRYSLAPFIKPHLQALAEAYLTRLMDQLDYIGVLTLECFVKGKQLYANEIAPRVHNSGHLTLENANCSQFELHLRAVLNLPLPRLWMPTQAVMLNVIGKNPPPEILQNLNSAWHYYNYGKPERPGRKLGHLILLGS